MTENKNLEIIPLGLCKTLMPKVTMTYLNGFGEMVNMWVGFFYIRGANENILIDSGLEASLLRVFHPFPTEHIQTFREALATVGLTPEKIDKIFLTHMHFDHIGHLHECVNATVYVREEELAYAKNPNPQFKQFYPTELWEDKKINFETYSSDEFKITDGVRAFSTPGHTPYAMSVEVALKSGKAVITGFCTTFEAFRLNEGKDDIFAPGIHTDFENSFQNVLKVKHEANIIIPAHEPSLEFKKVIS